MRRSAWASVKWVLKLAHVLSAAALWRQSLQASLQSPAVVGVGQGLLVGVRLLAGFSKGVGIFDLFVEKLNGLAGIEGLPELGIVGFQIVGADHSVSGDEVIDDVAGGRVGVAGVTILKDIDVHVIDCTEE